MPSATLRQRQAKSAPHLGLPAENSGSKLTTGTTTDPHTYTAQNLASALKVTAHRLLHFEELPAWMQDNMYILTGYRPPLQSYKQCFRSLFYLHNETGNVYSHLLGALLFLGFGGLAAGFMVQHQSTVQWLDVMVMFIFIAGAVACLSLSTTFHLVSCHSHSVSRQWNKCDYLGIVFLIVGSFFPPIYYAFYCHPNWLIFYLTSTSALGGMTAYFSVSKRFEGGKYRWARTMLFIGMGLSGAVPLMHGLTIYGLEVALKSFSLAWILGMALFYIVGALIYAGRVPERWSPGRFDFWLHSHQIFHLFVVAAAILHYIGVVKAFSYHHTAGPLCQLP
ncbi:hypothetical protein H4R33_002003 [Dimargaris cristalligena]|uniref:Adiponectin receptor protein n=1 Tax=Dimargaris cristalligena TaxID=215637 RepID=A0A4P9ZZV7_9FUNG|nr:hypothetical protein H4R33_002003 [Dimargaris cristalligena]RKP38502.1 adiponectin receptor protein [Dimargaris cristalligena]|eukprot:RKP38502.1 adiponectin receptor protein [Dimargaris cristalligena]